MNPYKFEKKINSKAFTILTLIGLLLFYGVFNARAVILGPSIEIFSPTSGTETYDDLVTVKGKVENMTYLSINERPIYADLDGFFEEKLLLSPGFNTINIKARDRFENEKEETLSVYLKQTREEQIVEVIE